MIEYLLSAAMAIGPALGYIDQVSLAITTEPPLYSYHFSTLLSRDNNRVVDLIL